METPARSPDRSQQSDDREGAGLGADCERVQNQSMKLDADIDFSKIEADLTELKTFLYKQQRLARETRSQEAKD
jgi:hypothetical protein